MCGARTWGRRMLARLISHVLCSVSINNAFSTHQCILLAVAPFCCLQTKRGRGVQTPGTIALQPASSLQRVSGQAGEADEDKGAHAVEAAFALIRGAAAGPASKAD